MKNKLRRRLIDLTTQRSEQLAKADAALEANDQAAYKAAWSQVKDLDAQIQQVKDLIDAHEATPADIDRAMAEQQRGAAAFNRASVVRASNEYARAFCDAVRSRVAPNNVNNDRFGVLMNALTESGNDGVDGGFLVPVDMQTRIIELMRENIDLGQLVNEEMVTTLSGYRVIDTAPTTGFTKVSEMRAIPKDDQPAFRRVPYSVEEYSLIVPISNDLLNDNDAGLMEYLARWMAKKAVITRNLLVLTKLKALAPTPVAADGEIKAIKRVLNKGLDPAISRGAILLANQSAYDCLDQLEDSMHRSLIQPDLTDNGFERFKKRPIHCVSDALLANTEAGSPLFIGDLKQFMTIFNRQAMEFASTNVGGNAWNTNSTEGRAIMRLDVQTMDTDAAKYLQLAGGLDEDEADGGEG